MNGRIVSLLVALGIGVGVIVGYVVPRLTDDDAQAATPATTATVTPATAVPGTPAPATPKPAAPTPTASAAAPAATETATDPFAGDQILPGAIGPVYAGETAAAAVKAGWLVEDTQREQSCEGKYWKWAGHLAQGQYVSTDQQGTIVALGSQSSKYVTNKGDAVGATLADLRESYGDELSGPKPTDYGQSRFLFRDGQRWIGFFFDEGPNAVKDSSVVKAIEVTNGQEPDFGRILDGC